MFRLESNDGCAVFTSGERRLRVSFITESVARITYTEGKPFQVRPSLIVTTQKTYTQYLLQEQDGAFTLTTPALKIVVDKASGAIRYLDANGNLLMREPERGGKWLTAKKVYRNIFSRNATVDFAQSTDGIRAAATDYETVFDREAFEARLEFVFAEDEALFAAGAGRVLHCFCHLKSSWFIPCGGDLS